MSPAPGWYRPPRAFSSQPGWAKLDTAQLTSVSLGSITLRTTARQMLEAGALGATGVRSIFGWKGPARDRTESLPHWSGDGVVSLLQKYGARSISLSGAIQGDTAAAAVAAEDALDRFRAGVLRITEAGTIGAREADIRVLNLDLDRRSPEYIEWKLDVVADDPYRYSSSVMQLVNGTVSVPNRGNAVLSPVLELVGPHAALTIVHPGGTYTFPALAAGQTRLLDWRNGDVWNGNSRVFGAEGGRRPAVLAGGSQWTVTGLGAGTATLRRYEAWT